MDVFGPEWAGHPEIMAERWRERVAASDLVLLPGDISWAMRLDGALPDLEFLAALPGQKVLIRGNHDYWWAGPSKIRACLPPSVHIIQNDSLDLDGVAVGGSRLWDDPQIRGHSLKVRSPGRKIDIDMAAPRPPEENEKIFQRELIRLQLSLSTMNPVARLKIAMVHYPPVGPDLSDSRAAEVIEASGATLCVFGHLHALVPMQEKPLYGARNGVTYALTSCDYLDFTPIELAEV
jgi:predicted phosphohydrolase